MQLGQNKWEQHLLVSCLAGVAPLDETPFQLGCSSGRALRRRGAAPQAAGLGRSSLGGGDRGGAAQAAVLGPERLRRLG
jgi:hypothetical protein